MSSGSARVRSTSIVCGRQRSLTRNRLRSPSRAADAVCAGRTRCSSVIASAAAVASSSSDAFATSIPVRSRHHRLEIEQRLETALRDLRLVRRVRRVPARVLHHHPQDDARRDGVVIAEADVRAERLVRRAMCVRRRRYCVLALRPAADSAAACRRIDAGIASSISASSDAAPTAASIASRSSGEGPMWRRANQSAGVERCMLSRGALDTARLSSSAPASVGVRKLDLDHPCPVRIGVDGLRMILQRVD